MGIVTTSLREALQECGAGDAGLCVAFSGGRDSTVLLHALRAIGPNRPLRAIHVDHGLHPASADWSRHCGAVARQLQVPYSCLRVQVAPTAGTGPEAAAREARYAALQGVLGPGECLLTAHHQDDQLETVLLRLMRGSGPLGIAGIRRRAPFPPGFLLRPLLAVSGADLARYAEQHALQWLTDPSNADPEFDRNYLRHAVIPRLTSRWPAAARVSARAARLALEAGGLLEELADGDARHIVVGDSLELAGLRSLSGGRQRNLLRRFLRQRGLAVPGEAALREGLAQLLDARADSAPRLVWGEGELRRYRGRIYLLHSHPDEIAPPRPLRWDTSQYLDLGPLTGVLDWQGSAPPPASALLTVRFRDGGERLHRHGIHMSLKKLFQAGGILPWMRAHVPLVYSGNELLTVGGLWYADEWAHQSWTAGGRLRWLPRAAFR